MTEHLPLIIAVVAIVVMLGGGSFLIKAIRGRRAGEATKSE